MGEEGYVEPPWRWPEGTDLEVLEGWGERVETAKERVVGRGSGCYRKFYIMIGGKWSNDLRFADFSHPLLDERRGKSLAVRFFLSYRDWILLRFQPP